MNMHSDGGAEGSLRIQPPLIHPVPLAKREVAGANERRLYSQTKLKEY